MTMSFFFERQNKMHTQKKTKYRKSAIQIWKHKNTNTTDNQNKQKNKKSKENRALFYMLGTTIDYAEDDLKSGFVFENPNVTSECGCKESFTV